MTRMAEVLEGRHTDEEIADTDVQQLRDFTLEGEEQRKRRIAQHSLFVQVDGPGELLRPYISPASRLYLACQVRRARGDGRPGGAARAPVGRRHLGLL